MIVEHLNQGSRNWFEMRTAAAIHNRLTGERWTIAEHDPLELAGRLVQEDLCLIETFPEGPRLTAAALCFPSRWRLHEKLGRVLADVHGAVPLYAERLARPVDRFMAAHVRPEPPSPRGLNFSQEVMDDAALFQPTGKWRTARDNSITADNAGDRLFLRVERQTLRRLPASGAVLFGIRVHVYPLHRAVTTPAIARRLAAAVRAAALEMTHYKSLPMFGNPSGLAGPRAPVKPFERSPLSWMLEPWRPFPDPPSTEHRQPITVTVRLVRFVSGLLILVLFAADVTVLLRLREDRLGDAEKHLTETALMLLNGPTERSEHGPCPGRHRTCAGREGHGESRGVRSVAHRSPFIRCSWKEEDRPAQINALMAFSLDGYQENSTRAWPVPMIDIRDREYYQAMVNEPARDRVITPSLNGRADGKQVVLLIRKVRGRNGDAAGLLAAAIDRHYFEDFFHAVTPDAKMARFRCCAMTEGNSRGFPGGPDRLGRRRRPAEDSGRSRHGNHPGNQFGRWGDAHQGGPKAERLPADRAGGGAGIDRAERVVEHGLAARPRHRRLRVGHHRDRHGDDPALAAAGCVQQGARKPLPRRGRADAGAWA